MQESEELLSIIDFYTSVSIGVHEIIDFNPIKAVDSFLFAVVLASLEDLGDLFVWIVQSFRCFGYAAVDSEVLALLGLTIGAKKVVSR